MKTKKNKPVKSEEKSKPEGYVFGRPTKYTEELAERICILISTSTFGIKKLCSLHDWMPEPSTIHLWRLKNEYFSEQYTKAKKNQAELLAEETLDIADESDRDVTINALGNEVCNTEFVNRSRLRVDTRKWLTSKLLPKIYGDQKTVEDVTNENNALKEEMRLLRDQLNEKHKKEF
jgi:hypothetical protein